MKKFSVLILVFVVIFSFASFASYGDLFKGFGNAMEGLAKTTGSANEKEAKAIGNLFGSLGDMMDTVEDLSKTTVLEEVKKHNKNFDEFKEYLTTIDDKIKKENTSEAEREKILNELKDIFSKMSDLVDTYYKK